MKVTGAYSYIFCTDSYSSLNATLCNQEVWKASQKKRELHGKWYKEPELMTYSSVYFGIEVYSYKYVLI